MWITHVDKTDIHPTNDRKMDRDMTIIFAEQLRQFRKELGMTQKQLADALETTQRNVSYLELGKVEPDLQTLWKVADFFDVSIDCLLGRKDA